MLLCYLLLFLGLCQSVILRSKHLQLKISSEFSIPKDLMKTGLVDKNWVGVENVFRRDNPKTRIFENKQTGELFFETKKETVRLDEIVDVNARNASAYQQTRLHFAAKYNDFDFLEILLKRFGANPNIKDRFGETPLQAAVAFDHIDATEVLLTYGAEVDTTNSRLETSLMFAVKTENPKLVKLLLRYGANPKLKDIHGESALHKAKNCKIANIIKRSIKIQ